jgi:hypothetical protein
VLPATSAGGPQMASATAASAKNSKHKPLIGKPPELKSCCNRIFFAGLAGDCIRVTFSILWAKRQDEFAQKESQPLRTRLAPVKSRCLVRAALLRLRAWYTSLSFVNSV